MREIKFRGFSKADGWIFGCYATDCADYHAILMNNEEDELYMLNKPVAKDSVGQYTGLKDKNGVEIYEGDIIGDHIGIGAVVWWQRNSSFKVSYIGENSGKGKWFIDYLDSERKTIEVIGNIYENPELLESNND